MGDTQQRAVACGLAAASQKIAQDVVELRARTALDVAQHGRGETRTRRRESGAAALQGGRAGRKALARGNGGALLEQRHGEIRRTRRHDIADRRAHQAGDAGAGGDEHPLLPHLLQEGMAAA